MGSIGKVEKRGVGQVNKVLAKFLTGDRGEIKNIVVHQKMGGPVKTKVSRCNKRWQRGENIKFVAHRKMGIVAKA